MAQIWEERDNVLGFWSVLGCAMAAVTEVVLGLSSCSACLTYADIVDRLEMRRQQMWLAEKYPGTAIHNNQPLVHFSQNHVLDRFGSLISSWSSNSGLGNVGNLASNMDDEDEMMGDKGIRDHELRDQELNGSLIEPEVDEQSDHLSNNDEWYAKYYALTVYCLCV